MERALNRLGKNIVEYGQGGGMPVYVGSTPTPDYQFEPGNPLSETTFSPTDTPSITVIRTGDVDQDFDPS